MHIILTGSSGYIGQQLEIYLKSKNHKILTVNKQELWDIANGTKEINKADLIIHCAGLAHRRNVNSVDHYMSVNKELTIRLAHKAAFANIEHFIYISTAKVHGEITNQPITSTSPLSPNDLYSKSKAEAETELMKLKYGMRISILRPPLVYGESTKGNISILNKLNQLKIPTPVGRTENKRSFLSIYNLCSAIETLATSNTNRNSGAFLIHDGLNISTKEFINQLYELKLLENKPLFIHIPDSLMEQANKFCSWCKIPIDTTPLYSNFEISCKSFNNQYNWHPILPNTTRLFI